MMESGPRADAPSPSLNFEDFPMYPRCDIAALPDRRRLEAIIRRVVVFGACAETIAVHVGEQSRARAAGNAARRR